jgi:hypothetical protein
MSAPDGTFALKGLPDGPFFLTATDATDHIAVLKVDVLTPDVVDVRLTPAVRITAAVLGFPEASGVATVSVSHVNGEPYFGTLAVRTDPRGVASLIAPSGSLTLVARSANSVGTVTMQAQPGETMNVTIEMKPATALPKD